MSMSRTVVREMIYRLLIVLFGLMILVVSMARAGLEILAKESSDAGVRNDVINYSVTFEDGEESTGTYKLPETGMLPDNAFYGMRQLRDWLWLTFSSDQNKAKIALLLADKSAAEAKELLVKEKFDMAIETGNEAIDKLEYADKLINEFKVPNDLIKQVHYQIFWAGFAYKEIFVGLEEAFNIDKIKYVDLVKRINDWNTEQEKNRFAWGF